MRTPIDAVGERRVRNRTLEQGPALLDTDALSEIGRAVNLAVVGNATTYRRAFGRYTTSAVSVMKIVRGYQRTSSMRRLQAFAATVATLEVLPFDQPAAELAGRSAGDLERIGRLGDADPMVAAIALTHGLELAMGNTAHFQRVQQIGYPHCRGSGAVVVANLPTDCGPAVPGTAQDLAP